MQLAAPHMECIAWHAAYGIHMRQTAPRAASALLQCNTCNVTRDIQERHSQLQPISHSMPRASCNMQRTARMQVATAKKKPLKFAKGASSAASSGDVDMDA